MEWLGKNSIPTSTAHILDERASQLTASWFDCAASLTGSCLNAELAGGIIWVGMEPLGVKVMPDRGGLLSLTLRTLIMDNQSIY